MSPLQAAPDTPAFTHPSYALMEERWRLVRRCYEGTEAMRANYKDHFWQSPAESGDEFEKRCKRAEMFPAFKQTVDGLTGVAFRVEPQLGKDVPASIVAHAENIDGQGTHLVVFLKELFRDGLRDGHMGLLIDAPTVEATPTGEPKRLTRAEENAAGIRPYWIQVFPDNILSWRVGIIRGAVVLTQLVIMETSEEPDGIFSTKEAIRYRKYKREEDGRISFRVWSKQQVETWTVDTYNTPESSGFITNQKDIPFVVYYGGPRVAPLVSRPPLLDLAHTNISHMNVVSDRRNGLHAAMHPILVMKGRRRPAAGVPKLDPNTAKPTDDEQIIGPWVGIDLPADPNANVFYAEHQGHALGEGRTEIQDLEKRMAAQGLAMLQNDTRAAETAEAKRIDKDEKTANLSSAVRSLHDAAELAMAFHANYIGEPTGGSLVFNMQFEVTPLDSAMVTALSNLVANGQLSTETMWEILQNLGLLPEGMDFEKEILRIVKSGMVPGAGMIPPTTTGSNPTKGGGGAQSETGPGSAAA